MDGSITALTETQATGIAPPRTLKSARSRWPYILAVLLLVVVGATAGWLRFGQGVTVQYTTVPAAPGPIVRSVMATGTVNPVLTIIVGTYVSGVIQELYCDYNTEVKKGQLCAKIDPRLYQATADQDRANLAVAKAQMAKDAAALAYAKLNSERNATLARKGWVSQDTADNTRSAFEQAAALVELDQATIQQRAAALANAEVNLDYTNIVSPVDGTVVARNVTMGQTVAASFQTPTLFLISTDLTKMQVDTNVSESDIGGVREGNPATFTIDAFPGRSFSGIVTQVRQSPQTVQNVVTFDVVVTVDNPDLLLKPGMTATTKIVTAHRDNVLRVPDQAFRYIPAGIEGQTSRAGEQTRVWVLREGRPDWVAVKPGLDDDNFTEIVGGDLLPGDPLIVSEQRSNQSSNSSGLRLPRL